ncbi:MAG: hypothetical protein KAX54_00040 [Thauera sp.]|nr:hypothetical protein [Thauera sp.]
MTLNLSPAQAARMIEDLDGLVRKITAERDAARAAAKGLAEVAKRIESATNKALMAGMEEQQGGSARRQAKLMEPVYRLHADAKAALAAYEATGAGE